MASKAHIDAIDKLYGKTQTPTGQHPQDADQHQPSNPISICSEATGLAYPDGFRMRFVYVKIDENRAKVDEELRSIDSRTSAAKLRSLCSGLVANNDEAFNVVVWKNEPKIVEVNVGERVAGAESVVQFNGLYTLEFDLRFPPDTKLDVRSVFEKIMKELTSYGLKFSVGYYLYVDSISQSKAAALEKASAESLKKATAIAKAMKAKIKLPAFSARENLYYSDADKSAARSVKADQYAASERTGSPEKQTVMIGRPTPQEIQVSIDVVYQTE